MQSRRTLNPSPKTRRGFTLIELLVVISIIATLMSLILPAIQNAREAGRRTQCLNNIRNVTLAALNFASGNKSRLPALAYFPLDDDFVAAGGTATSTGRINGRSWVIELLPYMDQQATYDRWNKDAPFNDTTIAGVAGPNGSLLSDLFVEAFACPNDESAFQQAGGLTYVANTGFGTNLANVTNDVGGIEHSPMAEPFDWNGDSNVNGVGAALNSDPKDTDVTEATGVFWPEFGGVAATKNSSATIGKIYDGSGNTLMFGENINAGGVNFADPRTRACGFLYPVDGTALASASLNNMVPAMEGYGTAAAAPAYPNEAKTGPDGSRPFLNSNHPSIVVVSMCDGSARTISEDIDKSVYTSLITPSATRLRSGLAGPVESPLSGDSF